MVLLPPDNDILNPFTTDSLLHDLIENEVLVGDEAAFVWEYIDEDKLPKPLRSQAIHARNFSDSIHELVGL